jgi:dUTP pyrophosphatase
MQLKVKLLTDTAKLPVRAHGTDSGADIFSDDPSFILRPGEQQLVSTGISATVASPIFDLINRIFGKTIIGGDIQFVDKSGLANKNGIKVLGGLIDESYRGEWKVILLNTSQTKEYEVKHGSKLTQAVCRPVFFPEVVKVDELDDTVRGDGGFGSTGV